MDSSRRFSDLFSRMSGRRTGSHFAWKGFKPLLRIDGRMSDTSGFFRLWRMSSLETRRLHRGMAHLSGETSNQLFEVLSDWNAQLSSCSLYDNPKELPFQLDSAAPQKTAESAMSAGDEPVETYGSRSWTG